MELARIAHRAPTLQTGIFARLLAFAAIARQRRALARLDDSALADIGISRTEAEKEALRPFWDAPGNWRV